MSETLRIALVAPTAIAIPVSGYSGIEREVGYLAEALYSKGHEVHLFCNVAGKVDTLRYPWMMYAKHLVSENDAITHLGSLKAYDVVHDWSIAGDETIYVRSKTGDVQCIEIGRFVDALIGDRSPAHVFLKGDFGSVMTVGMDGKLAFYPITGVSRHLSVHGLCRVTLSDGRVIKTTVNHNFFDASGNLLRADSTLGRKIMVPSTISGQEDDSMVVPIFSPVPRPGSTERVHIQDDGIETTLRPGNGTLMKYATRNVCRENSVMGDVSMREVVDVEFIHSNRLVYDLEVPGPQRFIASGIIVHNTHTKPLRMARLERYLSTVMWTDKLGWRNVFPSAAVAEAFGKSGAAVVPLGLPTDTYPTVEIGDSDYYAVLSRVAHYKGTDLALDVAKRFGLKLIVAGHTGVFADSYYAMIMRKRCRDEGHVFIGDPGDAEIMAMLRASRGLIHLHRWLESFSLVIAQALCLGIPVLTSDRGGPKEYVDMLKGGCITPVPDSEVNNGGFPGEQVQYFLEKEWTEGERIALAERARELFNIKRIADIYVDIYRRL